MNPTFFAILPDERVSAMLRHLYRESDRQWAVAALAQHAFDKPQ
jgi:hypothetical protein